MQLQVVHLVVTHGAADVADHGHGDGLAGHIQQQAADGEAGVVAHLTDGEALGVQLGHLQDGLHAVHIAGGGAGSHIDAVSEDLHGVALVAQLGIGSLQGEVECIGLSLALGSLQLDAGESLVVGNELVDNGLQLSIVIGDLGHIGDGQLLGGLGVPLLDLGNDGGLGIHALSLLIQTLDGHGDIGGEHGGGAVADLEGDIDNLVGQGLVDRQILTDDLLEVGAVQSNGHAGDLSGDLEGLTIDDGIGQVAQISSDLRHALEYLAVSLDLADGNGGPAQGTAVIIGDGDLHLVGGDRLIEDDLHALLGAGAGVGVDGLVGAVDLSLDLEGEDVLTGIVALEHNVDLLEHGAILQIDLDPGVGHMLVGGPAGGLAAVDSLVGGEASAALYIAAGSRTVQSQILNGSCLGIGRSQRENHGRCQHEGQQSFGDVSHSFPPSFLWISYKFSSASLENS